jgi:hypothetical protein
VAGIAIDITDEAMDDLRALPSQELQRVDLQWIARLEADPQLGRHLEWRWGQDLRGCRKIYFDHDDTPLESDLVPRRRSEEGARYRIVYRLIPSEHRPEIAQVFAVGPKYGPQGGIYARAAERHRVNLEG